MINSAKSGRSPGAQRIPDCAEPVIGRRFAPTRWIHPGYEWTAGLADKML
jgi:hypothetical protein